MLMTSQLRWKPSSQNPTTRQPFSGARTVLVAPLFREGVLRSGTIVNPTDGGPSLLGEADRSSQNIRRSSRHRHRERAALPRTQGGVGTADRDKRDPGRNRKFADRCSAGAGYHRGKCGEPVCGKRCGDSTRGW